MANTMTDADDRDAARTACERLSMDFMSFVDARRYDELATLFASDGVFSNPAGSARGHAELRAFMERRPAGIVTRHLCTTVRIEPPVNGLATGSTTAMMFRAEAGAAPGAVPQAPSVAAVVDYADSFVRTAEGWRFASRSTSFVFDLLAQAPSHSASGVAR